MLLVEEISNVDLTVTSIVADSQNSAIYLSGYSSAGFQEVYKMSYDLDSYQLIATNKIYH
jgi:hypothetical protein